jgi:hypothetical protein
MGLPNLRDGPLALDEAKLADAHPRLATLYARVVAPLHGRSGARIRTMQADLYSRLLC